MTACARKNELIVLPDAQDLAFDSLSMLARCGFVEWLVLMDWKKMRFGMLFGSNLVDVVSWFAPGNETLRAHPRPPPDSFRSFARGT